MDAGSNSAPREPSPGQLRNPLKRYLLATRPAFLSVTLIGCLLGLASAWHDRIPLQPGTAVLGLLLALLAHAGINVCNDYYDALNGTDAANTGRLFPFTGGSRFIQNGVLTPRQTLHWALCLFLLAIAGGSWLLLQSGSGLLWIGLAGLGIGWAYSAPPLRLNSRGWGELSVAAGFLLLPVGMDFVQRHQFAWSPVYAGTGFSLLVCNLLYINQFPDRSADLQAGKRHWVARLAPRQARWGYVLIVIVAYLLSTIWIATGRLPAAALVSLLALPLSAQAASGLLRHADTPANLAASIRATILAAILQGMLMSSSLIFSRF